MVSKKRPSPRRMSVLILFGVLCAAAFVTRIMPLSTSQYPFNNDSLTECGIASEILSSHHLEFSPDSPWKGTHSDATPVFNLLIAYVSSVLGTTAFSCAQFIGGAIAMLTIGGIFLLSRVITGSSLAGAVSAFSGLMLGTFVFTTGSVWKISFGLSLFIFAMVLFSNRKRSEFRFLCLLVLIVIPFVHHLVAAMTMMALVYLVGWSLFFAVSQVRLTKRHLLDLITVTAPVILTVVYYSWISLDRFTSFVSPHRLPFFLLVFGAVYIAIVCLLSMKRHSRLTYAPIVGIVLVTLVLVDFSGFIFPYSPSAPLGYYVVLAVVLSLVFSFAWYGTELILETRPSHRAIQVAMAASPLIIIASGFEQGFTQFSQQVFYRTFDLLDVFIFVGLGSAVLGLYMKRTRAREALVFVLVIALVASFPYGFYSDHLLGVRHDTQGYEVDALHWSKASFSSSVVITDERLSYISTSMFWLKKDAGLPGYMIAGNRTILPSWICVTEESWTYSGVNNFPYGKVVVPESNFTWTMSSSNVLYVGGPSTDKVIVFVGSEPGQRILFGESL